MLMTLRTFMLSPLLAYRAVRWRPSALGGAADHQRSGCGTHSTTFVGACRRCVQPRGALIGKGRAVGRGSITPLKFRGPYRVSAAGSRSLVRVTRAPSDAERTDPGSSFSIT